MKSGTRELLRAAFVIGRRDVRATVLSRTFLLFLLAPIIPVLFGVGFATLSGRSAGHPPPQLLAVIAPARLADAIHEAHDRLGSGGADLPPVRMVAPDGDPRQAERLLDDPDQPVAAVLRLTGAATLVAPSRALAQYKPAAGLLLDEANRTQALGQAGLTPPAPALRLTPVTVPPTPPDHSDVARIAQAALFTLTLLLAPMLLSNVVEEKSNKVIEVLAAAVPVPAIFLGKLFGMLVISLLGLAVWAMAGSAAAMFLLHGPGDLVPPAVGWPLFVLLGFVYFASTYLLQGALFLGLGSHARSVREVQTLSMPVTMAQLVLFALASTAVTDPESPLARAAAIFPWSSALTMLAGAAVSPTLWVHALALVWQVAWISLSIAISAALFRRNVLKSGAARAERRGRR